MNTSNKRPERVKRFQAIDLVEPQNYGDHVNAVGMVFSLVGLIMRLKWAAWCGVYCAVIYLGNTRSTDDRKQTFSLLMLAISSLVMVYMQNPSPLIES